MTTLREAAQQALEYLEAPPAKLWPAGTQHRIITALRDALAEPPTNQCGETCERAKLCATCARVMEEPVQKPVAWTVVGDGKFGEYKLGKNFETSDPPNFKYWKNRGYELVPLYTDSPQRKPLTEDEIAAAYASCKYGSVVEFARAIERAHGIGGQDEP